MDIISIRHNQKNNINRENSIQQLEINFQTVNSNIKELIVKVDSITEETERNKNFNNIKRNNFSIINIIRMPMRKITVNAMSTIFTIADYAYEKVSCVKEGLYGIITEAQSKSKKKKSNIIPINPS